LYSFGVAIHDEVLGAALALCRRRGGWRFRPAEIVAALPHVDPGSVRTHVVSRCCVNAPKNHPHKWDYFERVARGEYEILPAHRRTRAPRRAVAERAATYPAPTRRSEAVHAVISDSDGWYVAECLEVGVVTQAKTLDALVANLRAAVALHLEDEDPAMLGVSSSPRIVLTYELPHDVQ
jgi:predicted RNase H-like HicB family nuclease